MQVFNDELETFSKVVSYELQNTSMYIATYQLAEKNARSVNLSNHLILLANATDARSLINSTETRYVCFRFALFTDVTNNLGRRADVAMTRERALDSVEAVAHPLSRVPDSAVAMLRLMKENIYQFMVPSINEVSVANGFPWHYSHADA